MPVINISVENKIAEADGTLYVCDNSDFVAKFAFDAEWEAYESKTARFVYNNSYVDVVFTGNECPVPTISGTYFFNIGVYAGNLHTTTPARVPCKKSILCGSESESSASQEVRNEFLDVLDKRTGDLSALKTTAKDNLVAAINEVELAGGAGSMNLRVADGYIQYSRDGGSTWTNLIAMADLKGDTGAAGTPGKDGAKGDPGAPGKDGHSPVVTATKSGKTTTISVDGAAIVTIEDGADGAPGKDGADGLNGKDGADGKPGAAGADGAKGADGITPTIGTNGNWYIGSTDTGKPSRGATGAQGTPGKDGSDATVTAASITGALGYKPAAPGDIPVVPTAEINANTTARHTHANKAVIDSITGLVTAENLDNPGHTTDLVQYGAFQVAAQRILVQIPTVPETLPNPKALTLKVGGATATYDGSSAQEVDFPEIVVAESVTSPTYTNQVPLSVDASGAIYNGVGYKSGVSLNSSGAEIPSSGVAVSGYIPVKKGDIIRIKDTSQANFDMTLMMTLTADKAGTANCGKDIVAIRTNAVYGTITTNGNVVTWDTSGIGYYFWDNFAWLRVTTHSADAIVTVNEEITDTVTTQNVLKPSVKVKKANVDFDIASPLLSGKTVVCFGDSIFGMTRDTTSVPAWAAAFTGAKVYNVGFGGCRMAVHPTSGYAAFSMWALAGVADEFNCPCIDGYKALGINTANASAFLADGTHLNEHGRQAFGEYIGGCLISPKA